MSRKSSLTRNIRLATNRNSVLTAASRHRYDPTSLTITEFQIKITESPKSNEKQTKNSCSELSQPGSSSTTYRQRSRESIHSDFDRNGEATVDISEIPIDETGLVISSLVTPINFEESLCTVEEPAKTEKIRAHKDEIVEDISQYEDQTVTPMLTSISTNFLHDTLEMRRQTKPDATDLTTKAPSRRPEADEPDDQRLTKSTVREPKYKLTDKVKRRMKQTTPILSGHVLDHYFQYGKPPFRNFGCTRDSRTCRY